MQRMKLSVLSDNHAAGAEYDSEWGLCFALGHSDGGLWLWDTGASDKFLSNAWRLGIDIGRAQGLMISHGHYDHTGGIASLLEQTDFRGPVYGHSDIFLQRYSVCGVKANSIGMDVAALSRDLPGFRPVNGIRQIAPGLIMASSITRRPGLCQAVDGFYLDPHAEHPDAVYDDSCLVMEAGPVRALILGCCHSGLGNTMTHLREELGYDSFSHVIGGMHLYSEDRTPLDEAVAFLREFDVDYVRPCHCTGDKASRVLSDALPGRMEPLGAGRVFEL